MTSSSRQVPVLSLATYMNGATGDRVRFIDDLFRGMKDYGFIILEDHSVHVDLLTQGYQCLKEFYSLPTAVKSSYISSLGGGQRGYTSFGKEHAKDSPVMDLKEFWHVGRELSQGHPMEGIYPPNLWPQEVAQFRQVFSKLFSDLETAGLVMLEALTFSLDLPKDYFANMTLNGNSILRLLHYPPIPEGVDPRCLRAAPHEDINLITLLPAATSSGLQLKDRNGEWLDVQSNPNALIVDAGDMLSRLTNNVIPSTTHQVVNTPEASHLSRYSMPFFMHPHPQAMLSCLPSCLGSGAKFAPISANEFLMQRLREIGLI